MQGYKMEKKQIEKMDLVNDIDRLFYDIENIEDQASVFRSILRLNDRSILKGIKAFIKDKAYIEPKKSKQMEFNFNA
jgi:hypothetical protein|tara:strand:- start:200 stop:430 length:231 start_codon:yes stop_codon:yes gene_type:complete